MLKSLLMASALTMAFSGAAMANKPNEGNAYIVCKDGTQQFYTAFLGDNATQEQRVQNAAARQGAIDRCGPANYSPVVGGPKAQPSGTEVSTAVNPRSLGASVPRSSLAQASTQLNELVATPRFAAMQRARDYRGMKNALTGIGVDFEMPPESAWKLCLPPQQWIWAVRFINHKNGSSSLGWVMVCGWPGDANPN